jgi:hypothetical protein
VPVFLAIRMMVCVHSLVMPIKFLEVFDAMLQSFAGQA